MEEDLGGPKSKILCGGGWRLAADFGFGLVLVLLFIGIGSYWYWPPSIHSIAIFSSAAGITDQPLDFRGDYLCGQGRECSACIYFNQSIVFKFKGKSSSIPK